MIGKLSSRSQIIERRNPGTSPNLGRGSACRRSGAVKISTRPIRQPSVCSAGWDALKNFLGRTGRWRAAISHRCCSAKLRCTGVWAIAGEYSRSFYQTADGWLGIIFCRKGCSGQCRAIAQGALVVPELALSLPVVPGALERALEATLSPFKVGGAQ